MFNGYQIITTIFKFNQWRKFSFANKKSYKIVNRKFDQYRFEKKQSSCLFEMRK